MPLLIFPLPGARINCGADALVRSGPPGRLFAVRQVVNASSVQRDEGVPRGPGGPPHYLCHVSFLQTKWYGAEPGVPRMPPRADH